MTLKLEKDQDVNMNPEPILSEHRQIQVNKATKIPRIDM